MMTSQDNLEPYQDNRSLLPGWPGYRTRADRSGYDPIDYRIEFAHVQGVLLRQLYTRQFQTRNWLVLAIMIFYGVISVTPFIFINFISFPISELLFLLPYSCTGALLLFNALINVRAMMKEKIEIIDLEIEDTEAIEQCAHILFEGFKENWPNAWSTFDSALEEVRESLQTGRISRIALDENRDVSGWIGGIPQYDGNVWELHPLVVKPENQESGIGWALVQDFERQVKERGGLTIILGSDDENKMTSLAGKNLYPDVWEHTDEIRNLKRHPYEFYQKLGYVIIGVVPDANGLGKPDILMSKSVVR